MKRRTVATPCADGNNNESSAVGIVDLCGTTHRPNGRNSVSFQGDEILDEPKLWKEKTSTEQRENGSSFTQVVIHLGVSFGF